MFRTFNEILERLKEIKKMLDQLTKDVANETSVMNSAVTLLNNLSAAIKTAGTDPIALKALTDTMEANATALSGAIVANTPAV